MYIIYSKNSNNNNNTATATAPTRSNKNKNKEKNKTRKLWEPSPPCISSTPKVDALLGADGILDILKVVFSHCFARSHRRHTK